MRIASLSVKFASLLLVGVILAEGYGLVRADPLDVVVTVSTDKSAYGWGETVFITISVTNVGTSTLNFVFGDSHQSGYQIHQVHGHKLKPIWTTLNDIYLPLVTYLTLEPGETENYTFEWAQKSEFSTEIKPATYVIKGYFVGTWTWSESAEFDIRGYGYIEH